MAAISLEIVPFEVPDDVTIKMPPSDREGGFKSPPTIKLSDLSEEALAALLEEFCAAVMAKAGKTQA